MTSPFFLIIPFQVKQDKELDPAEKLFYGTLAGLAVNEGYCFASNQYLADIEGVSLRQVQRWLDKLEQRGHIKRKFDLKGNRKIFITQTFQNKNKGGDMDVMGGCHGCHPYNNNTYIEREGDPKNEELSTEKEKFFNTVTEEIPPEVFPHEEIYHALSHPAHTVQDVAKSLDFVRDTIRTNNRKKNGGKITSYVALFHSHVAKCKRLREYLRRKKN